MHWLTNGLLRGIPSHWKRLSRKPNAEGNFIFSIYAFCEIVVKCFICCCVNVNFSKHAKHPQRNPQDVFLCLLLEPMFPWPTVNNIMHMTFTSLFTYRICPHCIIPPTSTFCLTEKINISAPLPNTLAWTCSLLRVPLRSLERIVMSWQRYEPDMLLDRFSVRLLRIQQKCASLLKKPFSSPPLTIKLFHSGTSDIRLRPNRWRLVLPAADQCMTVMFK